MQDYLGSNSSAVATERESTELFGTVNTVVFDKQVQDEDK